jgi:hypothetical protein
MRNQPEKVEALPPVRVLSSAVPGRRRRPPDTRDRDIRLRQEAALVANGLCSQRPRVRGPATSPSGRALLEGLLGHVAADARDMTQLFLAATKAAAAIAAALVTTGQSGHTAASNTAAHRRGGDRPPRGPGARPGPRRLQASCNRDSPVRRDNPDSGGGRTAAPHSQRDEEEGDSTGKMERHDAGTDRQRQTGDDATSDPSGSTQLKQPRG